MTENPEAVFLKLLFSKLNKSEVRYCVLRNYESLPYSLNGSDLDILFHYKDEKSARIAIEESIDLAGGVAIGYASSVEFLKIYSFGIDKSKNMDWWGVRLDVSFSMRYAGVANIVKNDILENHCYLHNGIRVLSSDISAVLGVIKELLHNDKLSPRYLTVAIDAMKFHWEKLCNCLSPMGNNTLTLLRDICLSSIEKKDIVANPKALRRALLYTAFCRSPISYIRLRFLHQWFKVIRMIKPSGIVVTIIGTDGTGKTTIISAIKPILAVATHGSIYIKHLRPGLLPSLGTIKSKQTNKNKSITDPHGSNPSGLFGSLFRVIYLMTDYMLGYWLVVRPKIAKSPAIVLFDRYANDMAIDPRRFRISLPAFLVRCVTRLAPKPDIIFCLYGDPFVITARKQELPLEEVKRQTKAFIKFAKNEPRAVLVSTEETVEQSRDFVLKALREFCRRKKKG